jgi:hypothetical protein
MEGEEEIKVQCESCRILIGVEEVAQRRDRMAALLLPLLNNKAPRLLVLGSLVLSRHLEAVADSVTALSLLRGEVPYSNQFRCSRNGMHRLKIEVEITPPEEELTQQVEPVEVEGDLTEGMVEDIMPRRVQTHKHQHQHQQRNSMPSSDFLRIFSPSDASSRISCIDLYFSCLHSHV